MSKEYWSKEYWCVYCQRALLIDEDGIFVHDDVPHDPNAIHSEHQYERSIEAASLSAILEKTEAERDAMRVAYENACKLVAQMHHAATGSVTGPSVGVVEDVAVLKAERDALKAMIYTVMNISNMSDAQLASLRANALEALNGEKP